MNAEPNSPGQSRGRVLVLLDGSRLSLAALETAADIAHARGTGVLGIYVEEVNLLRSAGYGFAREVGGSSGMARPLDRARMEARMQALAEGARKALEEAMARRGIPQTLERCRGQVVTEVLNLAGPEDLLILGRVGWSGTPGARLGSTARTLVQKAQGDVLLWAQPRTRPQSRVVVLLNHDQGANHRAVQVGADLALRHHQPLTVLVRTASGDHQQITHDLLSYLQREGIPARVRLLPIGSTEAVTRALREESASHLVVSRKCSLFAGPGADQLLQETSLPLTVTP